MGDSGGFEDFPASWDTAPGKIDSARAHNWAGLTKSLVSGADLNLVPQDLGEKLGQARRSAAWLGLLDQLPEVLENTDPASPERTARVLGLLSQESLAEGWPEVREPIRVLNGLDVLRTVGTESGDRPPDVKLVEARPNNSPDAVRTSPGEPRATWR